MYKTLWGDAQKFNFVVVDLIDVGGRCGVQWCKYGVQWCSRGVQAVFSRCAHGVQSVCMRCAVVLGAVHRCADRCAIVPVMVDTRKL